MKKKAKPKKLETTPLFETKDLRMTKDEWDEVIATAKAEADDTHIRYSLNNFCVRAVLAAARKSTGSAE